MNNLIYYPTFEPKSLNWLKYALVYIDNFSPIIPIKGRSEVSDLFKRIENETELIRTIEPKQSQGSNATNKAIEKIESIKLSPQLYSEIFNSSDIIKDWSNTFNWNTILYHEKFSYLFADYCVFQKFGMVGERGILMSESLASFYMTLLVEEIAYEQKSSPITDIPELDSLSTHLRIKDLQKEDKLNANKVIIDFSLPTAIENIEIDKFIQFRNRPEIDNLRNSYNSTVELFYNSVEQDFDPITYLESLKKIKYNLTREIGAFFGSSAAFSISSFLLSHNPTSPEIIKIILDAGVTITGIHGISEQWKLGQNRRNARKFLARVRKIGS